MPYTGTVKTLLPARPTLPARWVALFLFCVLLGVSALSGGTAARAAALEPTEAPLYESPKNLGNGAPAPKPVAGAWLVGNLDTGEVLVEENPEFVSSPASVQKLLTALALVDEFPDKGKKYTARESDVTIDGTRVGMLRDNAYTIDQLFHAMLMGSANDAAHALGEAAGGQDRALELIAAKAGELGMTHTTAGTTTGLDAAGQGTTVRDLFILAKAFTTDDYLMKIAGATTYTFPGGKDRDKNNQKVPGFEIQNHTGIVGNVDGGLGLKNGYTDAARGSFIAVAERGGTTYASVVLKSENSTRQAAIDLLEWAFSQKKPAPVATVALSPSPTPTAAPAAESATPPAAQAAGTAQTAGLSVDSPLGLAMSVLGGLLAIGLITWAIRRLVRRARQ